MEPRSPDRSQLERLLERQASRQHGVVSRVQLLRIGFGPGAIAVRLRERRLIRLHAGVYVVGHLARAPLAGEMAAVLACGEGAVVSHETAGRLWGLLTADGRGRGAVHVTVPREWAPRRRGIVVHRDPSLSAAERRAVRGVPVTSAARTLLDLGAVLSAERLEALAAEGERRGLAGRPELEAALARSPRRPGAAAMRRLLARSTSPRLTRSEAERRMLRLVRAAGLAEPETNARVAGLEVDMLWRAAGVVVEIDGFAFHADRAAFERDRRRDAELLAHGLRVVRITWRQLSDDPDGVRDRLARTLSA